MKVSLALFGLLAIASHHHCLAADDNRDDWVEPHAWKRPTNLKKIPIDVADQEGCPTATVHQCPPCTPPTPTADTTADFMYRKLINYMFNDKALKYDEVTEQYHRTVMHISLSAKQLQRIRDKGADLRDIDGVLQDIWEQSKQSTMELVREVLWSWNESILNFWSSLVANRVFLNTLQLVAIAGVYVWAKQRGTNVAVIVVGVTAFYVYRYLDGECQRKLDIERIANLAVGANGASNPCLIKDTSWYGFFFGQSQKAECIKYLESRTEKTCTVKDMYDGFMTEFVFGSIGMFFESFIKITANVLNTHGYLGMLVVFVLIFFNMAVLINAICKYVYGPLIVGLFYSRSSCQPAAVVGPRSADANDTDRLSGASIDRLLAITEHLSKTLAEKQPSGVEILEAHDGRAVPALEAADDATGVGATNRTDLQTGHSESLPDLPIAIPAMSMAPVSTNSETEINIVDEEHFQKSTSQDDLSSDDDIVILCRSGEDDDLDAF